MVTEEHAEWQRHTHKLLHELSVASFHAVNASGQSAIKATTAINGAGAAALLALIGHLWTDALPSKDHVIQMLAASLTAFLVGMAFGVSASASIYFAQVENAKNVDAMKGANQDEMKRRVHRFNNWNAATIMAAVASGLSFIVGAGIALFVMLTKAPT